MTLRIIEGFDFMPSGLVATERARIYGAKGYFNWNNGMDVALGRFDFGKAMWIPQTFLSRGVGIYGSKVPIGSAVTDGYAGIAVYVGTGVSGQIGGILVFHDGLTDSPQITVLFYQNGIIQVWRGLPSSGTMLVQTPVATFQEDQFFYGEARCKVDPTGGVVEVRVNTKTVISIVSANTKATANPTYDMIGVGFYNWEATQWAAYGFDDLYFCDTAGTENNNFLGNCRVMTQFVTGNSTPQNFLIGGSAPAATAALSLLNTNLDDTKFIHSGTAGDKSLFTIETIINAPMVFGIQVSAALRQDDATQRTERNLIKSGTTLTEGGDHLTNQTFTFYKDLLELNPATGVGYTGAELNALLIGPKVQV
jgi:hypothetical protein